MTHENMEKEQATWNQKKHLSSSMITRLEQEQERDKLGRDANNSKPTNYQI